MERNTKEINMPETEHLDFTEYHCHKCDWEMPKDLSNSEAFNKAIDHIYGHTFITDYFGLNREKAKALRDFLYRNGYISYEFHPSIIELVKDLDRFLKD